MFLRQIAPVGSLLSPLFNICQIITLILILDDEKSLREVLNAAQIDTEDHYAGQHALTLRMWVIGITFSIVGCGLNTLFTLRSPSISIAKSTAQLLAYPIGRLWDASMPTREFNICGWKFSLNPHPFNPKVSSLCNHRPVGTLTT